MNSTGRGLRILTVVAALAFLLGLAFTYHAVQSTPDAKRRIARIQKDMRALEALQSRIVEQQSQVQAFEHLASSRPVPLEELLKNALPGVPGEVRRRDRRPAAAGWSVRSADVTFDRINYSDLDRFIQHAEALRPPWRLDECNIQAAEQGAGVGRATLVLVALEKAK